jgi:hypothetical protein
MGDKGTAHFVERAKAQSVTLDDEEHPEFAAMHNQRLDFKVTLAALAPAILWSILIRLLFGCTSFYAHGVSWVPALVLFCIGPRLVGAAVPFILRKAMKLPDLQCECEAVRLRLWWPNTEFYITGFELNNPKQGGADAKGAVEPAGDRPQWYERKRFVRVGLLFVRVDLRAFLKQKVVSVLKLEIVDLKLFTERVDGVMNLSRVLSTLPGLPAAQFIAHALAVETAGHEASAGAATQAMRAAAWAARIAEDAQGAVEAAGGGVAQEAVGAARAREAYPGEAKETAEAEGPGLQLALYSVFVKSAVLHISDLVNDSESLASDWESPVVIPEFRREWEWVSPEGGDGGAPGASAVGAAGAAAVAAAGIGDVVSLVLPDLVKYTLWHNGGTAGMLVARLLSENLSGAGCIISLLDYIPGLGAILQAADVANVVKGALGGASALVTGAMGATGQVLAGAGHGVAGVVRHTAEGAGEVAHGVGMALGVGLSRTVHGDLSGAAHGFAAGVAESGKGVFDIVHGVGEGAGQILHGAGDAGATLGKGVGRAITKTVDPLLANAVSAERKGQGLLRKMLSCGAPKSPSKRE